MRSLVIVPLALSAISLVACVKDDDRRATTTLTNATVRSEHASDNAGYVDNGGRTSDETAPTELSGARPTDNAGRAPAEAPRTAAIPTAPAATQPKIDNAFDDRSQRISRAICDRETFCSRVGPGRTFKSQEECTVQFNPTARGFTDAAGCAKGVDETQLATCLGAVRQLSCTGENQTLQNLPACRSICNP